MENETQVNESVKKAVKLDFSAGRENSPPKRLVHSTLESAFKGARAFLLNKPNHDDEPDSIYPGWSLQARKNGIFIDLSKVEWCDLSATVRMVLFIERALKDGLKIVVALPYDRERKSEKSYISYCEKNLQKHLIKPVKKRVERRKKALNFLQIIQFEEAVKCRHLKKNIYDVVMLKDYDPSDPDPDEQYYLNTTPHRPADDLIYDVYEKDPDYRNVFPLTWITLSELDNIRERFEKQRNLLEKILGHTQRSLFRFDAEAVANVIFFELVQNVAEHSGADHTLAAAWPRPPEMPMTIDDFPKCEEDFFMKWIEPNKLGWVDIAVGDSGKGIPEALCTSCRKFKGKKESVPKEINDEQLETLFWSMGRWTTSKSKTNKRGTRGLYRILRMVKGYQGLITLRSRTVSAGWNHGGREKRLPVFASGLACVPGTFASIRLPAVHKAATITSNSPQPPMDVGFTFSPLLEITENGLDETVIDRIRSCYKRSGPEKFRCVVALITDFPKHDIDKKKKGIEKAFRQLKGISNPGGLVVLANKLSPGELDIYIDSVNKEIKNNPYKRRIDFKHKIKSLKNMMS